MSASASRRRALALAASGAAAAALAATSGCVSIGGGDAAVPVWYRLEDPGEGARASPLADAGRPAPTSGASRATAGAAQGAPGAVRPAVQLDRVLLVGPVDAPGFYDSTMVAFSRARGTIAHYQFAGWAERPGRRIAMLVERRLTSRARFAAVAQSTAGVRGDLLLNLSLEHLFHDVATEPGVARVAIAAELIDWRERRLIARRHFDHSAPVAGASADAAVRALGGALGALIDALCPWVEAAAAGGTAAQ